MHELNLTVNQFFLKILFFSVRYSLTVTLMFTQLFTIFVTLINLKNEVVTLQRAVYVCDSTCLLHLFNAHVIVVYDYYM